MKENFVANLKQHFQKNLRDINPIQKAIREKAWNRFCEIGLPDKKSTGYQYFPFSNFYQESYELTTPSPIAKDQYAFLIHPECRRSYLIFVNGQFIPEASNLLALPEEVVVLRLKDAVHSYGSFLQMRLSKILKEEQDPFATLNMAMIQMGLFIYVPPKVKIEPPLQCLHLISHDRHAIFNPRIHFFLGKESEVKWIYDHHCLKDFEYFSNGVIDLTLEEGSRFDQWGMLSPCTNGWCFEATRASLKRDSTFNSLTCTTGTRSVHQDFRISLIGENAHCDLKGLGMLSGNKQAHVNVLIEHHAPHTKSNQLFKSVLSDTSRCSFEGKIFVHSKAQKTQAYQLNSNLLLSDKAIANSKPNLEIFADDVKASHGATVTQLNPKHLFYLKTRGIDSEEAKMLLLSGFNLDILQHVPYLTLREKMEQSAERYLKK